jgi:hypothetical protein
LAVVVAVSHTQTTDSMVVLVADKAGEMVYQETEHKDKATRAV